MSCDIWYRKKIPGSQFNPSLQPLRHIPVSLSHVWLTQFLLQFLLQFSPYDWTHSKKNMLKKYEIWFSSTSKHDKVIKGTHFCFKGVFLKKKERKKHRKNFDYTSLYEREALTD